jgi:hypothetical protein
MAPDGLPRVSGATLSFRRMPPLSPEESTQGLLGSPTQYFERDVATPIADNLKKKR